MDFVEKLKSADSTVLLLSVALGAVLVVILAFVTGQTASEPSGKSKKSKKKAKNKPEGKIGPVSKSEKEVTRTPGEKEIVARASEAKKPEAIKKESKGGEKPKQKATKLTKAEKKAAEKKAKKAEKKKKAEKQVAGPVKLLVSDDESDSDDDVSTPPVAPPVNKKKKRAPAPAPVPKLTQAEMDDGWQTASKPKKKKPIKKEAPKPAPAPVPTVGNEKTDTVTVPAAKIGIIIGPQGATIKSIMERSGAKVDMEDRDRESRAPALVTITGPPEGVAAAKVAVQQLCSKGYCTLIQEKGFEEGSVMVNPKQLHEIIGKKGAVISVIQDRLNVKLSLPKTEGPPVPDHMGRIKPVRVGIAGVKDQVFKAKAIIKQIVKYHHSELTHPGMTHEEVVVPPAYMASVIGYKGGEMRHIQANYKVDVHIPRKDDEMENVLVVGLPKDVSRAKQHIAKLMERADEEWANQTGGGDDDYDY